METKLPRPLPPFIEPLRKLIREGKKTQTRRVARKQPVSRINPEPDLPNIKSKPFPIERTGAGCPYGKAFEIAYLREPLFKGKILGCISCVEHLKKSGITVSQRQKKKEWYAFYADNGLPVIANGKLVKWKWKRKTLSAMFMPRVAARTFVRIKEVRGEWLSEISEDDALEEGANPYVPGVTGMLNNREQELPSDDFIRLWNGINGKRKGCSFGDDPFVWIIAFELLENFSLSKSV